MDAVHYAWFTPFHKPFLQRNLSHSSGIGWTTRTCNMNDFVNRICMLSNRLVLYVGHPEALLSHSNPSFTYFMIEQETHSASPEAITSRASCRLHLRHLFPTVSPNYTRDLTSECIRWAMQIASVWFNGLAVVPLWDITQIFPSDLTKLHVIRHTTPERGISFLSYFWGSYEGKRSFLNLQLTSHLTTRFMPGWVRDTTNQPF